MRSPLAGALLAALSIGRTGPAQVTLGREHAGVAFRMVWFETADDGREAAIDRFVFPAGAPYPSQEIRDSQAIFPGATLSVDADGNRSMTYAEAIPVRPGRPRLLGFAADVSFLGPAYVEVEPSEVSWRKRVPAAIKRDFLGDEPEYDLLDEGIQGVVQELLDGDPTPLALMERLWKFVHKHMHADLPPRPNTGAEVLGFAKGLCGEYARLTTALARASGLAARETHAFGMFISGPASNDHAWADLYLPGAGWTPVQSQEDFPENALFPLHYYRYLIVYRGISFIAEHRVIEHHNVLQNRTSGVGFFAEMPAEVTRRGKSVNPRTEVIEFMQAIAADDGRGAAQLLEVIGKAYKTAQPPLYWALCGSSDSEVGTAAAEHLVALCQEEERKLDLTKFIDVSPALVRRRLDAARGEPRLPAEAAPFGQSRYYAYDKPMPWFAAKKYCELLGGHLVTITSAEEQKFVQGLPKALGKGHRFWIGLHTSGPKEPWQWVTDEDADYTNWANGFPDTTKSLWSMRTRPDRRSVSSDFAALAFAPHRWIDAEGTQLKGFICEWDAE